MGSVLGKAEEHQLVGAWERTGVLPVGKEADSLGRITWEPQPCEIKEYSDLCLLSSKNLEGGKVTEGISFGIIQCPIMAQEASVPKMTETWLWKG